MLQLNVYMHMCMFCLRACNVDLAGFLVANYCLLDLENISFGSSNDNRGDDDNCSNQQTNEMKTGMLRSRMTSHRYSDNDENINGVDGDDCHDKSAFENTAAIMAITIVVVLSVPSGRFHSGGPHTVVGVQLSPSPAYHIRLSVISIHETKLYQTIVCACLHTCM